MSNPDETGNPRLFGTNGIRGVPNVDLTPEFCSRIGRSIGEYFHSGTVVMGRDTRNTGDFVYASVLSGILSSGTGVIDLGVLPTPALQYYCKTSGLYGVVITASHNPPRFNGIKCVDRDGTELDRADEEKIEAVYYRNSFRETPWENIGRVNQRNDAIDRYHEGIKSMIDTEAIKKRKFTVLVDTGNGAAYESTPLLMEKLNCSLVTLNANPDGRFSSRNSEPKPENLGNLISLMKTGRFDLGIAHDGDADRAVFVDGEGNFIDGDRTLTLIVRSVISSGDKVVTPVSSSDAIDEVCKEAGANLIRTRVGAPVVSRTMIREKALIGGEENGGVIYGKHQYCRDGAMTAALVLDMMAATGKSMAELISELPRYTIVKKQAGLSMKWDDLMAKLSDDASVEKVDLTDGLRVIRDDGWILIRPSGTEPILRVYGQSASPATAEKYCMEFVEKIERIQGS